MTLDRPRFVKITVLVAALALSLPTFAANDVAKQRGSGPSVQWQVKVTGHAKAILSVKTPDGDVIQKTFGPGQDPSLTVSDLGGSPVDGDYNYELRVEQTVSDSVKAKLAAARANNDDAAIRKIQKEAGLQDLRMSGNLKIINGSFVSNEGTEPDANDKVSATARVGGASIASNAVRPGRVEAQDQVIPDDLIVQGSTCTGFDCVDNESFGFDTLRLKENNLRIHFDDTSSSAGFPSNDWRIIANDSASGGANKFVIEDSTAARNPMTIEAGAPANSLYVDSGGDVGIQQSTPLLDLHITTGDTPAIRLEQSSAGGFTAQTWDIGANEANFFVRDLTGGSKLPFRIRPGAPTSAIDVAASGNVGIGTASPEVKLHVFATSTSDQFVGIGEDPDGSTGTASSFNVGYGGTSFGRASGFLNVRPDSNAVAPNPSLRFMTANSVRMIIDNEGYIGLGSTSNPDAPIHYTNGTSQARLTTAGVWQDASSRKAKENIHDLDAAAALQALEELKPVTYNYKVLPNDGKVGFIAEDVPELVATPEREGLSALDIVAVVTKVVQEQQKTIEALNERIAELEKSNNQ